MQMSSYRLKYPPNAEIPKTWTDNHRMSATIDRSLRIIPDLNGDLLSSALS